MRTSCACELVLLSVFLFESSVRQETLLTSPRVVVLNFEHRPNNVFMTLPPLSSAPDEVLGRPEQRERAGERLEMLKSDLLLEQEEERSWNPLAGVVIDSLVLSRDTSDASPDNSPAERSSTTAQAAGSCASSLIILSSSDGIRTTEEGEKVGCSSDGGDVGGVGAAAAVEPHKHAPADFRRNISARMCRSR